MKKTVLAFFLLIGSFASAQIVNIPDPVFKQIVLMQTNPVVDINGDGEIQVSEALATTSLWLDFLDAATDLTGLRAFTNLENLTLNAPHVAEVDLSNMPFLHDVRVDFLGNNSNPVPFNISGCSNLEFLQSSNDLISGYQNINLANLPRLRSFIAGSNSRLATMDFRGCDSLNYLRFGSPQSVVRKLDISGLTKLDKIFDFYEIDTLVARNSTGFIYLGAWIGFIRDYLDVTGCINLWSVALNQAGNTNLKYLDFSSCTNLKSLSLGGYANKFMYINIKNGNYIDSIDWLIGDPTGLVPPLNVCADDFEIDSINNMIIRSNSLYGLPLRPVYINDYCSFFPGGAYNTLNGKIKVDMNSNGCDAGDIGMNSLPVRVTESAGQMITWYTNTDGSYDVGTNQGNFTVTPYFPYPYFTLSPSSANAAFPTLNNLVSTNDFCVTPLGVHNNLQVTFLPMGNARPGFPAMYRLDWKNIGNTVLSGNVQLQYDNSKEVFSLASLTPSSQSAGQITWNYTNLAPFNSGSSYVYFSIFAPPTNNQGDTLTYLASINPVAADETPSDNSFILPQRLVGSYDPNDKQCAEGSKIGIDDLNKPLHYVIHFQNLGTDTAFNVVVADTLASNVDAESFDLISSSHACHVKRKDNKLQFYFENIKLPYQAINDAGSNGYVAFSVKPKSTLVVGDSINNTASIYFDFNLPVTTNKATTIVSVSSPVPVKLEYFSLSSKDQRNLLTWKVTTTDLTTTFNVERSNDGIHFNNIGNITATSQRCQLPFNFTDDKPLAGKNYYRIKITDANGVSFYSKVLVTGKTKSGFDINAIVSDQNNTFIYVDVSKDQTVQLKIIAADGRVVYSQSKTIAAGTGQLNLKTGSLSKGIYTLIVYTNDGELITKRFVK